MCSSLPGMEYARTIIGYHGCTAQDARKLLGGTDFRASQNNYDWLGHGIYFWEYGPHRARRWIESELRRKSKRAKPAVIGAVIQLGRYFDLLDTRFTKNLADAYPSFADAIDVAGAQLPTNSGSKPDRNLRRLDCAVINWYLSQAEAEGTRYQTVRGCFIEGSEAYPSAASESKRIFKWTFETPVASWAYFGPC
jgi:hypothetical protein